MVIGIDPGTRKCGYAVVQAIGERPLELGIAQVDALESTLRELAQRYPVEMVALGSGTNAGTIGAIIAGLGLRSVTVDERETTLRARGRFFADHPPRGWRRLIPRGMLLPDRPIDDYAALLIAERYLAPAASPAGQAAKGVPEIRE
jgi:RNase H-fold protein (predicted Holliday junction resolvase)